MVSVADWVFKIKYLSIRKPSVLFALEQVIDMGVYVSCCHAFKSHLLDHITASNSWPHKLITCNVKGNGSLL